MLSCGQQTQETKKEGVIQKPKTDASQISLMGAGATFPHPLYSKMFDEYHNQFKVKINYQAIGSGGGIKQLIEKTVDFGGTDAPMKEEDIKKAGAEIVHIPICMGAVVLTYNLEGNPELKLSPEVIADIFLGKIKKWDDKKIKELNPSVKLPSKEIVVVHRSDGSGTTYIFSDYLAKISEEWKSKVGAGTSLKWPCGLGAKGNPGVAGLIKQTPNSIGYVELIYALSNNMTYAIVKNKAGKDIKPTMESVTKSANITIPEDTKVSLTNTEAEEGYPISGLTWLIVYKEQKYGNRDKAVATEMTKMFLWMIKDGQKYCEPLHYAPLSEETAKKAEKIITSLTYNGEKILP
ncbi:MAG: phosphate ABC transporter substrate-binding protein PstS [Candidatus Coatesbacteria bacterium]|nr:phosphate ABC transporter substrate-binding protein PstS [Candidatus Coatesbacteria bacterium]